MIIDTNLLKINWDKFTEGYKELSEEILTSKCNESSYLELLKILKPLYNHFREN